MGFFEHRHRYDHLGWACFCLAGGSNHYLRHFWKHLGLNRLNCHQFIEYHRICVSETRWPDSRANAPALTGTISNDSQSKGVTWSATGGSFSPTVTASGAATTYTAPASPGVYTLTATSVSDVTKSASVTIGVTDLAGVFTYHNNLSRDGSNPKEYALTPSNLTTSTFGKLFSCTVDGAIYAQPLWVANLTINSAKRNVVFVATQHESLYAFDADVNSTPCTPLWHVSLIDVAHGGSSSEGSVPSGQAAIWLAAVMAISLRRWELQAHPSSIRPITRFTLSQNQ